MAYKEATSLPKPCDAPSNADDLIKLMRELCVNDSVREAFDYILSAAASNPSLRLQPNKKGCLYEVKFFHTDDGEGQRYAFIANKQWLLWYFRKPAITKFAYNLDDLRLDFGDKGAVKVVNPPRKEITVRITDLEAAKVLVQKYIN